MVFGFDNGGQTANVFWTYIAFINRGIRNGERFIIPIHEKTLRDYPRLRSCRWLIFPFYNKFNLKLLGESKSRSLGIHLFKNPLVHYDKLCTKFPKVFVNGWELRQSAIDENVKPILRSLFIPSDNIVDAVNRLFNTMRGDNDIVIGMHIRRGDYASWRDGRYYYQLETYASVCRELIASFHDKHVKFLISSNESIPDHIFNDIDYFQTDGKTVTEDLFALSLCDFVIGPPSTFSSFAAFRGDIPIAYIMTANDKNFTFRKLDKFPMFLSQLRQS